MTNTKRLEGIGAQFGPMLRSAARFAIPGLLLLLVAPEMVAAQEAGISSGDTAWMLMSTGLVLFMTAGLAFFYGGLVTSKNVLNTMMMSFIAFGFTGVLWALFGYSLALVRGGRTVVRPYAMDVDPLDTRT